MRHYRRPLFLLLLAVVVPAVIFGSLLFFVESRNQQNEIKAAAVGRATEIMLRADGEVRALMAALEAMSSSIPLEQNDLAAFESRARRVIGPFPAWQGLVLLDGRTGRVLWSAGRDPNSSIELQETLRIPDRPGLGGVERIGESGKPYVILSYPAVGGDGQRVLAALVDPILFQNLLVASLPRDVVGGIVDRRDLFAARTLDYENRVGTSATQFVEQALRGGQASGVYRGRTWEGFVSYTAFYRSPLTGWSTHIAFDSALIDRSANRSALVVTLAGLFGMVLAVLLVVLVLREMAERRRADEAMHRAQKMEAVGQLSGGIAHDFNNLLTVIIGSADLIKRRAPDDAQVIRHADNAIAAARRGAKLASQLLAFSRAQNFEIKPVDLSALFNQTWELLQSAAGNHNSLTINTEPGTCVLTDATQLELALLNLAVNARDAMPRGGTVRIGTRRVSLAGEAGLPDGEYVEIAVADSGAGMSEEVKARAFEPFFTTKSEGGGTGLGLAQVFGIVGHSRGRVDIESSEGAGTTIRMLLPAAPPDTSDKSPERDDVAAVVRRGVTVN